MVATSRMKWGLRAMAGGLLALLVGAAAAQESARGLPVPQGEYVLVSIRVATTRRPAPATQAAAEEAHMGESISFGETIDRFGETRCEHYRFERMEFPILDIHDPELSEAQGFLCYQ